MASLTFTPIIPIKTIHPKTKFKPKLKCTLTTPPPKTTFSDPFVLQLADTLEDSLPTTPSPPNVLQTLRNSSSHALLTTPWPSRKDEPFRFTDLSLIRNSQPYPTALKHQEPNFDSPNDSVVIADGYVVSLPDFGNGVFVGKVSELSDERILKRVAENVGFSKWGDLFSEINGVGCPDFVLVYVPAGCRVEEPVCVRYVAVEGGNGEGELPVSNPRVFVLVEEGGEVGIVEEFVGGDGGRMCYWMNSVLDVVVGEGGKVRHSYVQCQSMDAAHTKWTSIRQESASSYELVEVSTGGKLSRHNLHIQQLGPDTVTELSTLHVSTSYQTQDLHSSLVLDHPRGRSQQLHKCIVAHSQGQAVFDGNVKVNRYAQQTDAGQLTRTLLLEPRATVNLKPNLQIIANDVKCSHGAAISDLEDSQLFYFLARGIDVETARRALIVSFAKEVVERLPYSHVRDKVDSLMKKLLDPTHEGSSEQE